MHDKKGHHDDAQDIGDDHQLQDVKKTMTALSSQKKNMMVNRFQSKNRIPTSGTRLATISAMAVGDLRA